MIVFNFGTLGPQSPDVSRDALNALEMSRMALWNMYNNTSPHNQHNNPSPPEVQQEALNLQRESPSPIATAPSPISIKRERSDHHNDMNDYPPIKRGLIRTNSDLTRKTSLNNNNNNNNNHHHISNNNNSHVTPTKDNNKKRSESSSPQQINENGNHNLQSPMRSHHKHNGLDSIGSTVLNGMQFKIISKGNNLKN